MRIEVRSTADNTVFATFIDRTGNGIVAASQWQYVYGGNLAETIVLTDNETALGHNFLLASGANRVDYSLLTVPVTANLGATNTAVVELEQQHSVNGDNIRHNFSSDTAVNRLTIVGSTRAGDIVNVTSLVNGSVASAGTKANTSEVDPLFHVVDLVAGTVTESLYGQYGASAASRAFVTNIVGFENASNTDADVVHMLGDNGRNSLTGGTGDDVIYGGRGTAGDGSADVGAGNRGDNLTGGLGADMYLYRTEAESPGGTIGGGQQASANFGADEDNVVNSRDTITGFVAGSDNLVFQISDTYDSVRGSGALPANLANPLNAAPALSTIFAAGDTQVIIGKTAATAGTVDDFDNYHIDTMAATLTIADVVLRVMATGGSDMIDASAGLVVTNLNAASADGLQVNVVYTAASQSQAGGFDQIIHFTSGSDKIDLSFLKLGRYETSQAATGVNYDTDNDNVVDATVNSIRTLGAAPIFAVNGAAANMFMDGTVYRPIATQSLVDGNGDPSTTVFIDADGNGNYDPNVDMVVILVGVTAPVHGDFIFDQYGGAWGG